MKRAVAAELVSIVGLVVAQAALFGRLVGSDTDYDEGVYLVSVDALEHGQRLGADVFAPQPPAWYLLLRLISVFGADSVSGFHIGMVVVAIGTCLAGYLLARSLAGPIAGLTAAALLTVAPPFPLYAHRVLADIPPLGVCLLAFWLAWEASERRSIAAAAGAGALLATALALKPTAALALIPFLVLLLWQRSGRRRAALAAAVGAAVVGAALLVAYRDVIGELWQSVVVYHQDARDTPPVIDKTHALVTFLNWRTPFAWLVVVGLVASVALLRRHRVQALWALWLWAVLSAAFLVYYRPLHDNHLLVLPVVFAVPAGIAVGSAAARAPLRSLAVTALTLVLVAGYVQQQRRVAVADVPEEPELVAAAGIVRRETGPGDLVVSDQSIVPYLADRRVPGPLVDTARLRFETGSLTTAKVLRDLERYDVAAVVVGRSFAEEPALLHAIESRYSTVHKTRDLRIFVRR